MVVGGNHGGPGTIKIITNNTKEENKQNNAHVYTKFQNINTFMYVYN